MSTSKSTSLIAKILIVAILATGSAFLATSKSHADTSASSTADLQSQINDRNAQVAALQKEIDQYQAELETLNKSATTLKGNIKELDTAKAKFNAQITLAQRQIGDANLQITQLQGEINDKESQITKDNQALAETLRSLNQSDATSLIETFMTDKGNAVQFWDDVAATKDIQDSISQKAATLKSLAAELQSTKAASENKKTQLVGFQSQLSDQKALVVATENQKTEILNQTKSQQSNYQALIKQKQALENQFDQELVAFEAQLNLKFDPGSIPAVGSAPLSWPLGKIIITQFFGNTAFAQAHEQAYNGMGHNGIDLGTPIGTPILAADMGVVKATGNTDLVCPNASFGKWVLIQHPNGLSTLYAHLSVIKAAQGDNVTTGEIIGYSGETGYATGPHLHFTVYASQGVEVAARKSLVCKGTYTMPLADLSAYLNPLNYLPPVPES